MEENLSNNEILSLLELARGGDTEALGRLLHRERGGLIRDVNTRLDARLRRRVDPTDIVQEVCLEVHRYFDRFRGVSVAEWKVWLGTIVDSVVVDHVRRHVHARQRSVNSERVFDTGSGKSGCPEAIADDTSPSQRCSRNEQLEKLFVSVDELTPAQRDVLRLRYISGLSLREICERTDQTADSVAGLLKRGLQTLRHKHS